MRWENPLARCQLGNMEWRVLSSHAAGTALPYCCVILSSTPGACLYAPPFRLTALHILVHFTRLSPRILFALTAAAAACAAWPAILQQPVYASALQAQVDSRRQATSVSSRSVAPACAVKNLHRSFVCQLGHQSSPIGYVCEDGESPKALFEQAGQGRLAGCACNIPLCRELLHDF
jgi:hypothetical protein